MRIYHSVFALLCMVVPFLFSCSSDAPDLEHQLKQESINEGESHVSAPQMVEFEGEQTLKFKNVMSLKQITLYRSIVFSLLIEPLIDLYQMGLCVTQFCFWEEMTSKQ